MPLVATSNSTFGFTDQDAVRSSAKFIYINAHSLKPNTKFDLYIENIESNWCARQLGKDLGDSLISDEHGYLLFGFLFEFPFEGQYSFDTFNINSDDTTNAINQSTKETSNFINSAKTVELRSPTCSVSYNIKSRILVTFGHTNRSEHHGH